MSGPTRCLPVCTRDGQHRKLEVAIECPLWGKTKAMRAAAFAAAPWVKRGVGKHKLPPGQQGIKP